MAGMTQVARPARDKHRAAGREKESTFLICTIMSVTGLILIGALVWHLETRRRVATEQGANQAVAGKVEAAREHLAHRDWDRAVELLEQAVATENATCFGDGPQLLARAQRGQAGAVLEAAEAAVGRQDAAGSLKLLRDYLANPHATEKGRALRLKGEIELAVSDEKAVALLRGLPDQALLRFGQDGTLPAIDGIHHPVVREMYRQRLRGQLACEQHRRVAAARLAREKQLAEARRVREEQEKRMARIQSAPVFRDLMEFVALMEKKHRDREADDDDPELLAIALEELGVTDPQEQSKLLGDRRSGQQAEDRTVEQISRKRANVKERFRSYKDFDEADRELFDRAVDWVLDRLLEEIKAP